MRVLSVLTVLTLVTLPLVPVLSAAEAPGPAIEGTHGFDWFHIKKSRCGPSWGLISMGI